MLKQISTFFIILSTVSIFTACVSPKIYYHKNEQSWSERSLPAEKELTHSIYLIGDVGKANSDPLEPSLKLLNKELMAAGEAATVVFLGDNIYPAGLPEKESPDRRQAEKYLTAQLDAVKESSGNIFFVPGNHDWNEYRAGGRKAVLRQEKFIEEYLGRKGVMKPGGACGDPKAVELTADITLILIDSQWFLHDWDKEPEMNKGCKVKSRDEFKKRFEELVDKYDSGRILVVLHHPLFSNGEHGGYFSLKDHIFPLTALNDKLYIPLPLIGSFVPLVRYLGISNQETAHPFNKELVDILLGATYKRGNILFASGHEHTLQYLHEDNVLSDRHFIVSGNGSKHNYFRKSPDVAFAFNGGGFAKLSYYNDGSTWLEMMHPLGDGSTGETIFRSEVKSPDLSVSKLVEAEPIVMERIEIEADSIYTAGKRKKKMLGTLYRDAWGAKLRLPVLDLSQAQGGLTPIKKGGGFQTQSLRLQSSDGKQYVLRSVAKDVNLAIEGFFPALPRNSFFREIVQDLIAMSHPYGAWVVPPLADAAAVFHTNPRFYYVPKQAALGDFSESFGNQVFLFEERAAKNREDVASFGRAEKFESTPNVVREMRASARKRVDQQAVLRARLFDMFLGDWDRHDDQWRWAVFEHGNHISYKPVPRDRDQAFSIVNGFLPWLLTREWAIRYFHNFQDDTRDIEGLNRNARWFDRSFLTDKNLNEWMSMADSLKVALTDEVIVSAIKTWPKEIYELNGEEIIGKLKSRRDKLPEFAARYYRYLAVEVDVLGSDHKESFEITRLAPHRTKVVVYRLNKEGEKKEVIYDREFLYPDTKEVRLYGFGGKDEFHLSGKADIGTLVRIIGGKGEDIITDESSVGGGKRSYVYDDKEGNVLALGKEARDKTSNDPYVNSYDRKAFKLNTYLPLILPGFNVDDGFTFGGGIITTKYGFRKDPYKSSQQFFANFAFATNALSVKYKGDFVHSFGKWDFQPELVFHAPTYVINYFGLGNETEYGDRNDDAFDFNRLRMSEINIFPAFKKTINTKPHKQVFLIGPQYTFNEVQETEDRFVAEDPTLSRDDFDPKHFGGIKLAYHIDAVDNAIFPSRGLRLNVEASWRANLQDLNQQFTTLAANLAFFHSLYAPTLITFGTRVGYAANFGQYEFFQAQTLGRRSNLRGFRGERFAGDAAFYHNTDLRIRLFKANNYFIPFEVGLVGFYDYGRVWLEGENSTKWHQGYGGGILISPLQAAMISTTYAISEELNIFEVRFSLFF